MESFKKYKPLKLITNHESDTGFETLVAEMTELSTMDIGTINYTGFSPFKGEIFIFLYDSEMAKKIIANPDDEVEINTKNFKTLPATFNNFKNEQAHFHIGYLAAEAKLPNTKVVDIAIALECKLCAMVTSFTQPVEIERKVIADRNLLQKVLSGQVISCNWCRNKGKGNDETKFSIYNTNGLVDNYSPTKEMLKRSNWHEELDSMIKLRLKEIFQLSPEDWGWTKRCAYCKLVFKGTYEKDEVGIKRGMYDLHKIILEDGSVRLVEESPLFLFDVNLNEELPIEFTVDADKCITKSIQTTITKDPLWASLITIKEGHQISAVLPTNFELIQQRFIQGLSRGWFSKIENLLDDNGIFEIQNKKNQSLKTQKKPFLNWLKKRWKENQEITNGKNPLVIKADYCANCNKGCLVYLLEMGAFPYRPETSGGTSARRGMLIKEVQGKITEITSCNQFQSIENPLDFEQTQKRVDEIMKDEKCNYMTAYIKARIEMHGKHSIEIGPDFILLCNAIDKQIQDEKLK